jgi:hypothetical protein|tara:strand:- start:19032 stop:19238 length:207 start_codon:yes stop_codon:yes gene_type:complete
MNYKAAAIKEISDIANDTDLSVGCVVLSLLRNLKYMGHDLSKIESLMDISDKDMYRAANKSYKTEIDE